MNGMKSAALLLLAALHCAGAENTPGAAHGRIFYLDLGAGRVLSANPDGSDRKVLLEGHKTGMDGIAVDVQTGHIFWTNMGKVKENDGSIERMDLDGGKLTTIVPSGGTFTAKQLKLDQRNGKLYWSDREGMRVMRSNLDGSVVETLVETAHGAAARLDAKNWCVGIALDVERGKIYWTQKGDGGTGSIRRANLQLPEGADPAQRPDIEVLLQGLPEPIDIDLDVAGRMIYWTDRGDPPRGNTVNRAPIDRPAANPEILVTGLREGIGIALDVKGGGIFFTDLGGTVYHSRLDGSDRKALLTGQGSLTGIVYVDPK
jgi:hypothetical protein